MPPRHVWPQSFDLRDVLYWVNNEAAYGRQAVYLDDANVVADLPTYEQLVQYETQGINIVAPPTFALLALDVTCSSVSGVTLIESMPSSTRYPTISG